MFEERVFLINLEGSEISLVESENETFLNHNRSKQLKMIVTYSINNFNDHNESRSRGFYEYRDEKQKDE